MTSDIFNAKITVLKQALARICTACEYSADGPCAGAYKDQGMQAITAVQSLIDELEREQP